MRILLITLFLLFAGTVNATAADPVTELKGWLELDSADRPELTKQSWASASLSREQAEQVEKLLVEEFRQAIRNSRAEEWKAKSIELDNLTMKFDYRVFGEPGENGRSLFISMHGGGGAPPRVNEQQWKNQIGLYKPEEGVYLAPRAPTDTWNLWHQSHIDKFFQRIIENAIVFENVDPNRVYIMGYSAGGDGVYQLAPRMADSLAAAAMMAGHPNDASPLGLRNIGFTLHMGGKDSAYNRNGVARKWKEILADLQKNDPGGYRHEVVIHEEYGHWMNREDGVAVPWMSQFTRQPRPEKIVWKQASTTHDRFYWLAVDSDQQKNGSLVVAERNEQKIVLEKVESVDRIRIRLDDQMLNLDEEITIETPDGETRALQVARTMTTIYKCLKERFDPAAVYSAEVDVEIPSVEIPSVEIPSVENP